MSFSLLTAGASGVPQGKKGAAFHWLVSLGAPGVFGIALVDATIIPLAIPGSTDLLLLWIIGHGGNPYLLVGSALLGTLIGGWTTWRLGKKGGEAAIKRYVPRRLQNRVQGWSQKHPLLVLLIPAMLPPPIPLWPFLLAAGALGASWRRFLVAFGTGRLIRYGLVGWLAVEYGRRMIKLYASTLDKYGPPVLLTFVALTVIGLGYSIWKFRRLRQQPGAQDQTESSHTGRRQDNAA